MRRMGLLVLLVSLLVTTGVGQASARPTTFNPSVIAAYSLAAPTSEVPSGIVARAVIPKGAACPNVVVSMPSDSGPRHDEVVMFGRNLPTTTSPAFNSITVCQGRIPLHAIDASIMGHPIPAHMPSRIRSMAMFGDSGCRIWPIPDQVQDCANRDAWPLADIAQSIVEEQPDAVIFNGDFFYREAACPAASQAECGSSPPPVGGLPFTDSAYGWIADVLLPMAPVLAQAPLIVTRGNHETCNRAGNGYFLLFDPRRDTVGTCAPIVGPSGLTAPATTPTATYVIDLAVKPGRTLRLAIVDSAGGSDTSADGFAVIQRPAYESAAALTTRRADRESWLVTHRPVYGFVSNTFAKPGIPFNPWTSVDQTAASFGLLSTYDLVFSAHMHLAQSVQIPGYPGQLVLGNGGTMLDSAIGYPLPTAGPTGSAGQQYPAPTAAWVSVRFGYAMAYPNARRGSWRMQMKDPAGASFARCGTFDRRISCADATVAGPG